MNQRILTQRRDLVPSREAAAAVGRSELAVSTPASIPAVRVEGPIGAVFQRQRARREVKTFVALAESTRAQTEFVNARADLARSLVASARAIAEVRELPVSLEHDFQMREASRERDLANARREAAEAKYGYEATLDEIATLRAKQRRKTNAKERAALNGLEKAKIEMEAIGRDTSTIDAAIAEIERK